MSNKRALAKTVQGLEPIQEAFLEDLAANGGSPEEYLARNGIAVTRLGKWVLEPTFRAAFLLTLDAYERMWAPAFWAHVRNRAMNGSEDAEKWAKLYAGFLEKSPPVVVQGGNKQGVEGKKPAFMLDQEDLEDLES